MSSDNNRTARIEARVTPDALAIVKRAAEIQGRSLSDFVVAAAQEAVHRTISKRISSACRSRTSAGSPSFSPTRRYRRPL